jgi:hypothetical protein
MENIVTVRAIDSDTPMTVRTSRLFLLRRLWIEYTLTVLEMDGRL